MPLNLQEFITHARHHLDSRLAVALENIQDAINQTAKLAGVDATGHTVAPDPPNSISVKANKEAVHVTIQDNTTRGRTRHYFVEHADNPGFANAHTYHLGVGREQVLNLPTFLDDGTTKPNYYFRTYTMEPGSKTASAKINFGGALNPTAVTLTGTTALTLLPAAGSGTTPSNGQKSGQGFGTSQFRKGSK